MGKTRESTRVVSRPIMVAPEKAGANCAFKRVCCRKCITPQRPVIDEQTKKLVRKQAKKLVKKINRIKAKGLDEERLEKKIALAKELVFLLEGAAIPRKNGDVEYAVCGHTEGRGMQAMQMFSPEELAEILQGVSLEINLAGAYMGASGNASPSGFYFAFSRLLAYRSAIELPEKRDALESLIMDGGMEGIRIVSRMAGEPTTSLGKRREYLKALSWVISCAEFSAGKTEIKKEDLALASSLSRFFPVESLGEPEDGVDTVHFYHMAGAGKADGINEARLRQMVTLAVSELFMGLVDISARINSIFSSSPEQIENYSALGEEYYAALEFGTTLLAGKCAANLEILLNVCESRKGQLSAAKPRETAMLKHIVRKLNKGGMLDQDAAEGIVSALGEGEADMQEELARINFYPGMELQSK